MLPLQNFNDRSSPVVSAAWLNEIDNFKVTLFGNAQTPGQARIALTTDAPLEVANGGTGARAPIQARLNLTVDAPLEIANGGTGARSAVDALESLGALSGTYLTDAEDAAGITGVQITIQYEPGNVLRYGAAIGAADNTTAFGLAIAQAKQVGGAPIYVPPGTWIGQFLFTGVATGIQIKGAGINSTTITPPSTTASAITFVAASSIWGLSVENMTIRAAVGSTAGHGIFIPTGLTIPPFSLLFDSLYIYGFGGSGIYDQMGAFTTMYRRVLVNQCSSHAFDVLGANTTIFENCYALNVPIGTGKAGYRVHGGQPILLSCNGVNAGDYWGLFSDTVVDDGLIQYCRPIIDSCNVEGFTLTGIKNKQASATLRNTLFTSHVAGNKACEFTPNNTFVLGLLDNDNSFQNTAGAWQNSLPVHIVGTSGVPFSQVNSPGGNAQFQWYDEVLSATVSMTTDRQSAIKTNRYAKTVQDLYVKGLMRTAYASSANLVTGSVTVNFGTALPDTSYIICLASNANETMRWSAKTVNGFTITSSNPASTATVDWKVELAL